MKLNSLLVSVFLLGTTSVFADTNDFSQYCSENADNAELSGEERNDYMTDCLYQFSVDEPSQEEEYEEEYEEHEEYEDESYREEAENAEYIE